MLRGSSRDIGQFTNWAIRNDAARKVIVGLSSHWPCVTGFVVYTTCEPQSCKTDGWSFTPTVLWHL